VERDIYFIGHIAEPFPLVHEFALSARSGRVFLYVLPDGKGGFCGAYREERLKSSGEHPSSEVMALRKYLGGTRLDRFCEKRGAVALCAAARGGLPADESSDSDDGEPGGEGFAGDAADENEIYCFFSRHAAPGLLVNGKRILGRDAPLAPALRDFSVFEPYTRDHTPGPSAGGQADGVQADGLPPSILAQNSAGNPPPDAALRLYFESCRARLVRQAEGLLKKQAALIERVRLEQQEYARHEEIRRDGELLKSQLWLVKRGMAEIVLTDYFADGKSGQDGATRTLALDPVKTPQENVAGIFARAAKYRRGLAAVEKRLREIETVQGEIERTVGQIGAIAYPDFSLLLPHYRRFDHGAKRHDAHKSAGPKTRTARALPYRVFEKKETIIWVGKNAASNALISLKLAAGNDLWFHVKDYAGSHVILRRRHKGRAFTEREIQDAALLALYYSEARSHGREDVSYTEAKHLRAVPGARAGSVHAAAARTLTVTLDEERLREARQPAQVK